MHVCVTWPVFDVLTFTSISVSRVESSQVTLVLHLLDLIRASFFIASSVYSFAIRKLLLVQSRVTMICPQKCTKSYLIRVMVKYVPVNDVPAFPLPSIGLLVH